MASFEQNKTNRTWSVRFRIIETGALRNKRLSGYKTKKDAQEAHRNFMTKYAPEVPATAVEEMTFGAMFKSYLTNLALHAKESTLYVIQADARNHILPTFGDMPLNKISKQDILAWQEKLVRSGYSYKFYKKLRGFLSACFNYAVKYLDFPSNPVSTCPMIHKTEQPREMAVWDVETFNQFINCVDNDILHSFFVFLFYTGCRKGEAFAVTWEDVDFNLRKVTINKNITRKVSDRVYAITTPKNAQSNRKILMPNILIDELNRLRENGDPAPDAFIFGGDHPLSETSVSRKFKEYCAKANVKPIRLHDFRHSHASYLISKGASIVLVSRRLGHSNTQQTLNTYSHLMPNDEEKVVSLF